VITGDAETGYVITNTHEAETIEISGTKTWKDNDDQDGKRPESITIRLLADNQVVDSVVVTAEDDWAYTFTDLPKYADGKEIVYTITEDAVSDYSSKISGYNVTNSYTPGKTSLTVTKVWEDNEDQDGIRPRKVTVVLVKNGEATNQTLTLRANNNWTGTFTGLDEYTDGELNVYTVQEVSVEGYTSVIIGDAATGYVITNTHVAETFEISGSKTWVDDDNASDTRPASITIHLYADGELVKSIKVTEEDDWSWTFTGLPKYANGKEITYTITEDAVDGYTTTVKGYDVTNTLQSTATDTGSKTQTGDQSPLARYFTLMIAALGVFGVGAAYRRRKQSAEK